MMPQFPPEIPFDQIERITSRLKDLVRNYPKGLGLVKEFLQNADDAEASNLIIIYDRRQHEGHLTPQVMRVALGPSLLFVNDKQFSDNDFKRIQDIGGGGKVHEATGTGRFGQGFNTCYSVSDHPSLITGKRIAWFDPHHIVFGPGKNARAWELSTAEQYWPDWVKTFAPAGLTFGNGHFPGTIFRLPLRTAAEALNSEISQEAFTDEDFESILKELRNVGAALLVFLRSVTRLEVHEISADGKRSIRFRLLTKNGSEVCRNRAELRGIVKGEPLDLLNEWLRSDVNLPVLQYNHNFSIDDFESGCRTETWAVTVGLFRGPENNLLLKAIEVCNNQEKAIPWAGAAMCLEKFDAPKTGGLACFLPIPEQSVWPVWLHGWFDLSSNRRGITRAADVSGATKTRFSWNMLLMEHAVGMAWALLVNKFKGQADESEKPYQVWLRPAEKPDDIDSALISGFYQSIADLPVIRCRNSEDYCWSKLDNDVRDLPSKWHARLAPMFIEEGWLICEPSLPEFVLNGFRKVKRPLPSVTPKILRHELMMEESAPDISCVLEKAPRLMLSKREWIYGLAEFCADGDWENLHQLPLAILSDGLLHTFTTCGKLYLVREDERNLLKQLPEKMLDVEYQQAIRLDTPVSKINLDNFDLNGLLDCLPDLLAKGTVNNIWLADFFRYITVCPQQQVKNNTNRLEELELIPDQTGCYRKMCLIETPLIPGKISDGLKHALIRLGVPLLTATKELESAIAGFASKHEGYVWDLTPNDVAYNLKSHADEPCLNEESLEDRNVLEPLLDFLSSTSWLSNKDDRLPFLRQVRILPTICGQRVAAQEENVYVPGGFQPPKGIVGQYRLLDTGKKGQWYELFKCMGVPVLDGCTFVERVFLPAFISVTRDQCRENLIWVRDEFRLVERDLGEEQRKRLRQQIQRSPILPVEGGELQAPRFVYHPDAREPKEFLGELARIPDNEFFSSDKELWLEFFEKFELQRRPLARDIYARIKFFEAEALSGGVNRVRAQLRKLVDHLRDRWQNIAEIKVDGGMTLAEALAKTAWLPAIPGDSANYAACEIWPDRLWRANELVPARLANLVASKRPVLDGQEFPEQMSKTLGLVTQVDLHEVLEHFSKVRLLPISEGKSVDAIHRAAEGFYRYVGLLDGVKAEQIKPSLATIKDQLCIFIGRKWWSPNRCYFEPLPFNTDWAVSLSMSFLAIHESSVRKGLELLGVRLQPDNDDWLQMLHDLHAEFEFGVLPHHALNQARHALRRLRSAPSDWLCDEKVLVTLVDGSLGEAQSSLLPDDPRLHRMECKNPLPLIENNDDALDVGRRAGARSLRGSLVHRLQDVPVVTKNPLLQDFAAKIERRVRSNCFHQALRRIAYEEALHKNVNDPCEAASDEILGRPKKLRVRIARSIQVESVVDLSGDEIIAFEYDAPSYLDDSLMRLWLKEGSRRRMGDELVRAICELCGLTDQLRLSRVLDVEPEKMSSLLDEEEVATIPDGQTLNLEDTPDGAGVEADGHELGPEKTTYVALDGIVTIEEEEEGKSEVYEVAIETINEPTPSAVEPIPSGPAVKARTETRSVQGKEQVESGASMQGGMSSSDLKRESGDISIRPSPPNQERPTQATSTRTSGSPAPRTTTAHGGATSPKVAPTSLGHGSSNPWGSPQKGEGDKSRQVRLRTYVHEKTHDDYDTGEAESNSKELGNLGEAIVMEYEKQHSRTARQMPVNHEGYDIESKGADGLRLIEVKSIDGPWGDRGVGVTRAQCEAAGRLGKDWWLYVVEHVKDASRAQVHPIPNPFHFATEYRFDSGWRDVETTGADGYRVPSKPQIGASYERESGDVVKIEVLTQHGEFWRVRYTSTDGSAQSAIWNASWRKV